MNLNWHRHPASLQSLAVAEESKEHWSRPTITEAIPEDDKNTDNCNADIHSFGGGQILERDLEVV